MSVLRRLAPFVLISLVALVPHTALANAIPYFGPLIEGGWNRCPLSWAGVINVVNNAIAMALTFAITLLAPAMFAYAGFLMVTNPYNPSGISKAKSIMTNTIVGIVIALAAWILVDAIMAVLYRPGDALGAWSEIVQSGGLPVCLKQDAALVDIDRSNPQYGQITGDVADTRPDGVITGSTITSADGYTYDPGITAQLPTRSRELTELLACMRNKLPAGTGRISSISDSAITSGKHTFAECAASRVCSHAASSCHYGGSGVCNGRSYAVDFGDDEHMSVLTSAAKACGAKTLNENDHLHVSIGALYNCGCDVNL